MRDERLHRVVAGSRMLRRLLMGAANRLQMLLLAGHKSPHALRSIRRARSGIECLLSADEAFVLHAIGHAQARLDGDYAELGVFEGASAGILSEVKGLRRLHLFDTFEGLPRPAASERRRFSEGQFRARFDRVRARLAHYENVLFHKGMFDDTAPNVADVRFALVHLDVDLEESTLSGLEFFYERMLPNGIIVAHDVSTIPGVARAFERFLVDKPERLIELPTSQGMLIKLAAPPSASASESKKLFEAA